MRINIICLILVLGTFFTNCSEEGVQQMEITNQPVQATSSCGNGKVELDEQCDTSGETAYCNANCTLVQCGDRITNMSAGEACDDGNALLGDGCDNSCQSEAGNLVNVSTTPAFNMVVVPPKKFFYGMDDSGMAEVKKGYQISEAEVTYELWHAVYTWATHADRGANIYTFANAGREGHDGTIGNAPVTTEPVTTINWRDAMVFMNALTEWYNVQQGTKLDCVYYTSDNYLLPIRDSSDTTCGTAVDTTKYCDNPYVKDGAKGFRLPTSDEWELAARYIHDANSDGDIMDAGEYYPGSHASGALADYTNATWTGMFAVYSSNSGSSTANVKSKLSNALGLYDMSGNVVEWAFDWHQSYIGSLRVVRGGSYGSSAYGMQVGMMGPINSYEEYDSFGFRFSRNP